MSELENEPSISGKDLLEELDRLSVANPSAGLDLGLAGLECFANAADEEFLANLHRLVAVCAHYAQRLEHALIHGAEASRRYAHLANDECVVRCEMIVAVAEAGLGLQVRGIQRIQSAIQLAASAGITEMEALAWANLSHLYWTVERYDMALECTSKAISMTDVNAHRRRAGVMFNNMAELCCRIGQAERAVEYIQRSRELLEGDNGSAFLANQAETESQICEARGDLAGAVEALHRAIEHAQKAASVRQEISYSERLGRVELQRANITSAELTLRHAKKLSLALEYPHRIDEICEALASVYERKGMMTEAAGELRLALDFRGQKSKREFDETLRSLESAHKMDLAQREAEILRYKNKELRSSEERYALAARGSAYGIWDFDLVEMKAEFSDRYRELLGYLPNDEFPDLYSIASLIHPEDGMNSLDDVLRDLKGDRIGREARILHRSGVYRWYQISGIVVFSAEGHPIRMVGSLGDVNERKMNELAIMDARDRAEEASRLKSEFLANMSHEIRTPMNGVIGLTDVLLETPLLDYQREHLLTIQHCGKSLLAIINDILDLSKIEADRFALEEHPVDLRETLHKSSLLFESQATAKGLEFQSELPDRPVWVLADEIRVSQIVGNLLSNASKFTDQGAVSLRMAADTIDEFAILGIVVRDTGIGIPEDRIDAVFDSFVQADGSTTRRYGGTGLGLTISRRLAQMMGGEITVSSQVESGSTFTVTLRLPVVVQRLRTESAEVEPRRKRARVLIAEDNAVNQMVAQRQLERLGCEVVVVSDGQQAVQKVLSERFDLVLMDLQMPVQDGISATREIRDRERAYRTPIVALTANAFDEHRKASMEAGMDGHVAKPFRVEDLQRILEVHILPAAA